jgi:hypothetical protein
VKVRVIVREDSPQWGTVYRTFDVLVPAELQLYLEGRDERHPLPEDGTRGIVGAEQVE